MAIKRASLLIILILLSVFAASCNRITATAEPGGSISPSGTVCVWKGSNKTFTMTPAAGNTIADVRVDGASVPIGTSTTYTFTNVQSDHSIAASFITDVEHYRVFNLMYATTGTNLDGCQTCHATHLPTASPLANGYGNDVNAKRTAGYTKYQSIKLIEPLDSDGDGFSNIDEITARTYPGDAGSHP